MSDQMYTSTIPSFSGLLRETLRLCAKQNDQIQCPTGSVLVILDVVRPPGTRCREADCPGVTNLKDVLLRSCFRVSVCDAERVHDAVCRFFDGVIIAFAACVKGTVSTRVSDTPFCLKLENQVGGGGVRPT